MKMKIYKNKFIRLTSFMKIIVGNKVSLFKRVFQTFYKKKFNDTNQRANIHVKMCLQDEELTGKSKIF